MTGKNCKQCRKLEDKEGKNIPIYNCRMNNIHKANKIANKCTRNDQTISIYVPFNILVAFLVRMFV